MSQTELAVVAPRGGQGFPLSLPFEFHRNKAKCSLCKGNSTAVHKSVVLYYGKLRIKLPQSIG